MTEVKVAATWPDSAGRRLFEATMLDHHAQTLSDRYPTAIWPGTGAEGLSDARTVAAVQQAFVDGIRFACKQFISLAADMRDEARTALDERDAAEAQS